MSKDGVNWTDKFSGHPTKTFKPLKESFHPHSKIINPLSETFHPHYKKINPHSGTFRQPGETINPHSESFRPHDKTINPHTKTFRPLIGYTKIEVKQIDKIDIQLPVVLNESSIKDGKSAGIYYAGRPAVFINRFGKIKSRYFTGMPYYFIK